MFCNATSLCHDSSALRRRKPFATPTCIYGAQSGGRTRSALRQRLLRPPRLPISPSGHIYRHISLPAGIGWDSWIRTSGCRSQSPVPYHLAIPQYESKRKSRKQLLPRCRHAEKRAPVGSHHYILLDFRLLLVPGKGFEPSHRMTLDPTTSASASFAIRAQNADY